ncbi:MAG: YigZ family protein [Saprospiraceae bacterium]
MDAYFTIENTSVGEFKDKGSKFLAYVFPFGDESELPIYLAQVKDEHPKARHYCYAYKLGIDGDLFRMNDDGEPSGTAGKPIYGQILSFELSDVLVIVVRYFGGTKLGASGLIQAYKKTTSDALHRAGKKEIYIYKYFTLFFPIEELGNVYHILKLLEIEAMDTVYVPLPHINLKIRKGNFTETLIRLKAGLLHIAYEQAVQTKDWAPFNLLDSEGPAKV